MSATRLNIADEYFTLIRQFPLVPIVSKQQKHQATEVMKSLTKPDKLNTLTRAENDYLEVLTDLIEKYEKAHHKSLAKAMTPRETLRYLLEQSNTSQSALASKTKTSQSHISEFLQGKRDLSKESIIRIAHFFRVSPELFLSFDK